MRIHRHRHRRNTLPPTTYRHTPTFHPLILLVKCL
jgi:hypothetical protein